jgi:hypothetical protein
MTAEYISSIGCDAERRLRGMPALRSRSVFEMPKECRYRYLSLLDAGEKQMELSCLPLVIFESHMENRDSSSPLRGKLRGRMR